MSSLDLQKLKNELKQLRRAVSKLAIEAVSVDQRLLEKKVSFFLGEVDLLITKTSEEIKKMESSKLGLERTVFEDNYAFFTATARNILYEETVKACDSSKEFGQEPYRSALIQVSRHPDIAQISYLLVGIFVDYRMNDVAGWRSEYFRAVEAASETNREETPSDADPDDMYRSEGPDQGKRLSDLFWEEKVYNADYNADVIEKYDDVYEYIVRLRFSNFKNLAPFWELLDKGNVSPKREAGGRGIGKPYPIQKPTHFVLKAENRATRKIKSDLQKETKRAEKAINENIQILNDALNVYNAIFQELINIIENIRLGIQRSVVLLKQAIYTRAIENIQRAQKKGRVKFTEDMKQAVLLKAEETAYKILAGQQVEQAYLGAYGGTGGVRSYQVRVRTIDLIREVSKRADFAIVDKIQNIAENLLSRISNSVEQYKDIRAFAERVARKMSQGRR